MLAAKVTQDPLDHVRPPDAGNDPDRTATVLTDLDIEPEHALEKPRPGHRAMLHYQGCLTDACGQGLDSAVNATFSLYNTVFTYLLKALRGHSKLPGYFDDGTPGSTI